MTEARGIVGPMRPMFDIIRWFAVGIHCSCAVWLFAVLWDAGAESVPLSTLCSRHGFIL